MVSYKTSIDGNVTAAADGTSAGQVNSGTRAAAFVSYPNNSLAYDINRPAGSTCYHKPRGSWKLQRIYAKDGTNARPPLMSGTEVYVLPASTRIRT